MDIRIGAPPPVGSPGDKASLPAGVVEAKVLAVRSPRSKTDGVPPNGDERREHASSAASSVERRGGRVLVLLIPEGQPLPDGLDAGAYRVFLRFAKK